MSIPAFWNTPFSYTQLTAVTDVATIIAQVDTDLRALGWTDVSGTHVGPWVSPSRADGVSFKIAATRTSATRITWNAYDQSGMYMTGSAGQCLQDIDAGGCNVQIYGGTLHFAVSTQRATPEGFWCGVLDQTPDLINVPKPLYVCVYGPRTSDGTLRNYTWDYVYMMLPGQTTYAQIAAKVLYRGPTSSTARRRTAAGTALYTPAQYGDYQTGLGVLFGQVPQAIAIDVTGLSVGSEITVPFDGVSTGVFKVVGQTIGGVSMQVIAFRKS